MIEKVNSHCILAKRQSVNDLTTFGIVWRCHKYRQNTVTNIGTNTGRNKGTKTGTNKGTNTGTNKGTNTGTNTGEIQMMTGW